MFIDREKCSKILKEALLLLFFFYVLLGGVKSWAKNVREQKIFKWNKKFWEQKMFVVEQEKVTEWM